jgi:PBP1b-binding outer membrane lipoprotein LpoB
MLKRTGLLSLMAVAVLAGCAKSPPPASVEDAAKAKAQAQAAVAKADTEEAAPAPVAPAAAPPAMDRSAKAAGLLTLIDTAPQCQSFRTQIEEAAKIPADSPQAVDMNQIVAAAHDAGCGKKP